MKIKIRKKLLYHLLKQNKFCYSNNFISASIPFIKNYVENQCKVKLGILSSDLLQILKKEFRILKYEQTKVKGGNQKLKLIKKIENEVIEIELPNEECNLNEGKFFSI